MSFTFLKPAHFGVFAATVLSVGAFSTFANAGNDTASSSRVNKPIVLAQAQPTAATPAAKKKRSAWAVQCGSIGEKKKRFCRIQNSIRFKKTGQKLLGVVIQARETEPKIAMQLSLPHGLYLPAGTIFKIDKGEEKRLVIETCNPDGCYASVGLTEKMIEAMKNGTEMFVAFQANDKQPITIPVTLKGFTAAFSKVMLEG